MRDPIGELLDQNEFQLADQVSKIALKLLEIEGVEKCEVIKCGQFYRANMQIEVSPRMSVKDAHDITGKLKSLLRSETLNLSSVLIHVEQALGRETVDR